MEYDTNESIDIPKGIDSGATIRFNNKVLNIWILKVKGHTAENFELPNGDLVIKVTVQYNEIYKVNDRDIIYNLKVSLYQVNVYLILRLFSERD